MKNLSLNESRQQQNFYGNDYRRELIYVTDHHNNNFYNQNKQDGREEYRKQFNNSNFNTH